MTETPPKAPHSGYPAVLLPMNAHKVAAGIIALGLILGSAPAAHAGWLQLLEGLVKGGGRAAGTVAEEGSTIAREAGATERAADAVVGPLLRIPGDAGPNAPVRQPLGPPTALQKAQGEELTGGMLLTFLGIAALPFGYFYGGLWLVRRFQRRRLAAAPKHSVPAADATAAQG